MKKKFLQIFSIGLFLSTNLIYAQNLQKGLVLDMPFSGNANDHSQYHNNGIVNGAVLTTDRFGNSNSAYEFGINRGITIPKDSSYQINFPISISYWVNLSNTTSHQRIFNNEIAVPNLYSGLGTQIENNNVKFSYCNALGYNSAAYRKTFFTTNNDITPNKWHNIVIIFHKLDSVSIFVNNKRQNLNIDGVATSFAYSKNRGDGQIGTYLINNLELPVTGKIDDLKMWNRELTLNEVYDLFHTSSDLVLDYKFNGNANDDSQYHNNGIVNGAVLTTDRYGNPNSAYEFGVNRGITIPKDSSYQINFPVSISYWVNLSNTTSHQRIFNNEISVPNLYSGLGTQIENNNVKFSYCNALGYNSAAYRKTFFTTNNDITPNKWHNIVIIFHKLDSVSIFVNNKKQNLSIDGIATSFAYSKNRGDGQIGTYLINNLEFPVTGKIDDLKMWNRELTLNEVSSQFNNYVITNIPDNNRDNELLIAFPNPFNDKLVTEKEVNYTLYNEKGIMVLEGISKGEINTEKLPTGIYILKINQNNTQKSFTLYKN